MSREGRLFSNTLLLGGGAALCKLLSMLLLPLYTAALTPAEFGTVEIFVTTAVLLIPVASCYAPQALFRFVAQGEEGSVFVGGILMLFGFLFTLFLLPLGALAGMSGGYRGLLLAYIFSSVLHSMGAQILRAKGAFGLFSLQQCFCAVLTVLLQVLFLLRWGWGARGYLLGVILGDLITFLVLLILLLPWMREEKRARAPLLRKMLRFALPLIPTALLFWVMSSAERYILLHYHGESALGVYAAAGRFPALIGFASGIFLEVWHYAAIREEGDKGALFGRIYALFLPFMILLGVLLGVAAPSLVPLFLARGYEDAVTLLPLLSLGAVCAALAHFLDSIYTLHMRSAASFRTIFSGALLHLLFCFWLIPKGGAMGAACAGALSFGGLFFLRLRHTSRELAFPRFFGKSFGALVLFFLGGVLFARRSHVLSVFFLLLAPLVLAKEMREALLFVWRRARAFFAKLGKRGKSIEKRG